MGYSVSFRARNPESKSEMFGFLTQHFRPWSEVSGVPEEDSVGAVQEKLSYDRDPLAVGFDYSSMTGWERYYIFTVCRWAALKVSPKVRELKVGIEVLSFPKWTTFIVYDGDEFWPVFTADSPPKQFSDRTWMTYDHLGVSFGVVGDTTLIQAAMDVVLDDEKISAALKREQAKIGTRPEDRSRVGAWFRKLSEIRFKLVEPEIRRTLPVVRAEIERLESLWSKRTPR